MIVLSGSYKAIQFDKGNKQTREGSVHITVRSPDKVEILSREYKKEGTFAYMTSKGGSYELCFHRIKASDQVTVSISFSIHSYSKYTTRNDTT